MLTLDTILSENRTKSSGEACLAHAAICSPFLTRLFSKDAVLMNDLLENLHQKYLLEEMQAYLAQQINLDENTLKQQLRQLRQRVLSSIIVRDLNGLADFFEVVETVSDLAEVAIQHAVAFHTQLLQNTYGIPRCALGEPQQFIVIGMGKLGGKELNVSSDVDLIFAYGQEGETDGAQVISNQDFFTKLSKNIISALDDVTEDGFVFRVDMMLRPFGSEGVLVSSLDALEGYYQSYGREWERYAWIKGRVVAGPAAAIEKLIKPFIYRKYLDYKAYASMREMKLQIQKDVAQRGAENNIKIGRGGIREVEFVAQVFQLIRGGQESALQIRPTLQVLQLLAKQGDLSKAVVEQLSESYIFLRNLEHRLMYIDDQQTQDLPQSEAIRTLILRMLNIQSWDALIEQLEQHRALIETHFEATFSNAEHEQREQKYTIEVALWQEDAEQAAAQAQLLSIGYEDGEQAYNHLHMLRKSNRYLKLPSDSKSRFDQLMPRAIHEAAQLTNANVSLLRTINFIETICRRASYLALLSEFPQALHLVVKLFAASPWLADYLTQHPILLDELLDREYLYAKPDFNAMHVDIQKKMTSLAGDTELQMDAMRHFKHAAIFRFAAQDIAGLLPLETLSDYLSALAQIIMQVSLQAIWQSLTFKHIDIPKFAVIGYGKLGGKELGYMSDLDIIFLYQDSHVDAAEIYARYAQRINSWFNSLTNAGLLYETDLELRPDGNSGLLVSSVEAFHAYQLNRAWAWEHQAITRAGFIAGDADVGEAFDAIRIEVIRQPRDAEKLRLDVLKMRDKMQSAQKISENSFNIKQSPGGIIDVEFMVQYLLLLHAGKHEELTKNAGNIALLEMLASLGVIEPLLAKKAADAYRAHRRLQHVAGLQGKQPNVETGLVEAHAKAVKQLWQAVFD